MSELPTYDASQAATEIQLIISPAHNSTSFQSGNTISGLVQLKLPSPSVRDQVSRLVVTLEGNESDANSLPIEFCGQSRVLFDLEQPSTSTDVGQVKPEYGFSFELPQDCPQCLHCLEDGGITYNLFATLYPINGVDWEDIETEIPLHLTRHATSLEPLSLQPVATSTSHAVQAILLLPQSTFKRSDVIQARVFIPTPSSDLVEGKKVRLRNIQAQLVRQVKADSGAQHEEVIYTSGKAAAFSSVKPVFITLFLRPMLHASCESITQKSLLHQVEFSIRITLALAGMHGDRQSITFEHSVTIVPDLEADETEVDKRREATEMAANDTLSPVPIYQELASPSIIPPSPLSAYLSSILEGRAVDLEELWKVSSNEEEYDGYEDLASTQISPAGPAPPPIDDDVRPPAIDSNESIPPRSYFEHRDSQEEAPPEYAGGQIASPPPYSQDTIDSIPMTRLYISRDL